MTRLLGGLMQIGIYPFRIKVPFIQFFNRPAGRFCLILGLILFIGIRPGPCDPFPYELKVVPESEEIPLSSSFSVDLEVKDATPGLDLWKIRFKVVVDPGSIAMPSGVFADPGPFIPSAFIVHSDPSSGAVTSVTYSMASLTETGSTLPEGLLARLYFDATQTGTAEIRIVDIGGENSNHTPLSNPEIEYGLVQIIDATTTATMTPTPSFSPTLTPTPSWNETRTPTPTPTETPTPTSTSTPTALFSLWLQEPSSSCIQGEVTLLPVMISDVSPGLRLSEINFDFEIDCPSRNNLVILASGTLIGSAIPDATCIISDLLPSASDATQAHFQIKSATLGSTPPLIPGKLLDIALYAHQLGIARVKIRAASPILDDWGILLPSPRLTESPIVIRIERPVTGFSLENYYSHFTAPNTLDSNSNISSGTEFTLDSWIESGINRKIQCEDK